MGVVKMVSDLTLDDGNPDTALSVIHQRLIRNSGATLTPEEAAMVLDWAETCTDLAQQATLMQIFEMAGGIAQIRKLMGPGH